MIDVIFFYLYIVVVEWFLSLNICMFSFRKKDNFINFIWSKDLKKEFNIRVKEIKLY